MAHFIRIKAALKSLGLENQYLKNFIESEVDDVLMQACLNDPQQVKEIIPVLGHRIKFCKAFSEIATPVPYEVPNERVTNFNHVNTRSQTRLNTLDVYEDSHQSRKAAKPPTKPRTRAADGTKREQMETYDATNLIDLYEPQPLQIMDFSKSGNQYGRSEVVFHKNVFEQIMTKTKSKKVAVISIAGPSRKGKSFFLNFIIRYLNGKKNNNPNWMVRNPNERLAGFTWKNSTERVTTGIWIWSEPFIMKSRNGEEFDLLIMDTQGVFDEHTSQREWSILVGLGLLTSSCLIFNIVGDLQEDILQVFENFLSFGLMALNGEDARIPFQKLVFLIRDWNVPGQYPYGCTGGRKYLDAKLDTKSSHKESHTRVRQQLKQCFEEISCFLLPHPGEEALALDFDGLDINNENFAAEIEKCIMEITNPVKIPLKKINGNFLTGADLLETFDMYCELFNTDEVPTPQSIFEIIVKNCNEVVIRKCVDAFASELNMQLDKRPFLIEDDLVKIKESAERACIDSFENSRKMGNKISQQQSKKQLLEEIEEYFEAIKDKNALSLEKIVSRAFEDAVKQYEEVMSRGMQKGFLSNDAIDYLSSEGEEKATDTFTTSCGVRDADSLPDKAEKLYKLLRSMKKQFINKNAINKSETEKELDERIQEIVRAYIKSMGDITKERILPTKDLEEFHESEKKRALIEFDALEANQELIKDAERNLRRRIDDEYVRICKDVSNFNEKVRIDGNSLVAKAASGYINSLKPTITINNEDFEKLKNDSLKLAQETVKSSSPIQDADFLQNLFKLLDDEVTKCNLELKDIFERNVKDFTSEFRNALEEAIKIYSLSLYGLLPKTEETPVKSEALEEAHAQEMQKATQLLEERFDKMCVSYEGADRKFLENGMVELEHHINDVYDSIKQQNAIRQSSLNSQTLVVFNQAKESYVKLMKEAGENIKDEETLRSTHDRINIDSSETLTRQLENFSLSLQQLETFIEELRSYIESEFEGNLEVFRLKMEEDECAVKTAFVDSREYYNDEMEKHFQSKDWLETLELQNIHDMIIETAIERGRKQVDISASQEIQLRELIDNLCKKYKERNLLRMPTDSYAIGIDLGTTYSCVAVCIKGKVTVIPQNEKTTVPSYVAYKEDHTIDVGEAAKELTFRRPEYTIFDAKRLIGRKFSDEIVQDDMKLWPFEVVNNSDQPKIKIPGHSETYFPEQVSARVLAHMKKMAEEYLNKTVKDAVVTVPAYFSDSQRQATKDAAQIAGLNAKILNEPTAAAIAYELHRTDDLKKNILIFDLGGGTFDVAVLNMKGGEINVKAIGGDTHLGGEDFDNEMVKHIIEVVNQKHNIDLGRGRDSSNPEDRKNASERLRRIRAACEKQKRIMSSSESAEIVIDKIDGSFNLEETFTKAEFERLNLPRFKQCIEITAKVISDANMDKSEIEDIVLIGGSTRIPKIRELLTKYFDGKALSKQINADEAVAYGAAVQAALLYGKSNEVRKYVSVSDVTPMPLGIEVHSGDLSVIINRNTPVPCTKSSDYYTVYDWQTTVNINIYEGEKALAIDNNKLGKFTLQNIPSAPKQKEPFDVSMSIDREGILHVEAKCRSTGNSERITIEEHKGRMSYREIELAMKAVNNCNW